jgi:very-short-patch-repair endonuclease
MQSPLIPAAKTLRKNSTDAENLLWRRLRAGRLRNLKFRRQVPIGNYVADFVCIESKIVIECDGGQHMESSSDTTRDTAIGKLGFKVLRFWNNDILKNIDGVLEVILDECTSPHPGPLPKGEGD